MEPIAEGRKELEDLEGYICICNLIGPKSFKLKAPYVTAQTF